MPFGLSKLAEHFPALSVKIKNEAYFEIFGNIHIAASWGGFTVDELFTIKIVAEDFPARPPLCIETSGKNTKYHINPGNDLCLSSPRTLHDEITAHPNIIYYINKFVIPFFFSFKYHQTYGISPFGELAHGGDGLLPAYREIFRTNDIAICTLLTYGTKFLYRGHHFCPCGSGLALRKCHGPKLRALFENYHPSLLQVDLDNCADSLKKHVVGNKDYAFFSQRYVKAKKVLTALIKGRGKA